jgi:predicted nucleic acid-binding protein
MKAVFADTFYFLALLNERDPAHQRSIGISQASNPSFVTTEFVLLELVDALNKPPLREEFAAVCALIQNMPSFKPVAASTELLRVS